MKTEAQLIAIAEACGWERWKSNVHVAPVTLTKPRDEAQRNYWLKCNSSTTLEPVEKIGAGVPDYLHDLNAMHEAETTLSKNQCYQYSEFLATALGHWRPSLGPDNWPLHATAAQRAEAFLRTLGKWTDGESEEKK